MPKLLASLSHSPQELESRKPSLLRRGREKLVWAKHEPGLSLCWEEPACPATLGKVILDIWTVKLSFCATPRVGS